MHLLCHIDYSLAVIGYANAMLPQVSESCNCKIAAISCYITDMVRADIKITTECEYKVICDLSNGVTFNDPE